MENNTALVKKEDGIYVMNVPERTIDRHTSPGNDASGKLYAIMLKQALSSAVECADQEQAHDILGNFIDPHNKPIIKKDHPYVIPGLTFTVEYIYENDRVALLSLTEINSHTIEDPIPAMMQQAANTIPGEIRDLVYKAFTYGADGQHFEAFLKENHIDTFATNSTEIVTRISKREVEEKTEKQEPVCQKCIDKDLEIQELKAEIEELSLYKHACNESIAHLDRENKALLDQIKDLGNQM
jgi:hypothetical protein